MQDCNNHQVETPKGCKKQKIGEEKMKDPQNKDTVSSLNDELQNLNAIQLLKFVANQNALLNRQIQLLNGKMSNMEQRYAHVESAVSQLVINACKDSSTVNDATPQNKGPSQTATDLQGKQGCQKSLNFEKTTEEELYQPVYPKQDIYDKICDAMPESDSLTQFLFDKDQGEE